MPPNDQPTKPPGDPLRHMSLGIEFAASVGLPLAGGIWLDWQTGWWPLFTLLGLALGFSAGLYLLIKAFRPPDGRNG